MERMLVKRFAHFAKRYYILSHELVSVGKMVTENKDINWGMIEIIVKFLAREPHPFYSLILNFQPLHSVSKWLQLKFDFNNCFQLKLQISFWNLTAIKDLANKSRKQLFSNWLIMLRGMFTDRYKMI